MSGKRTNNINWEEYFMGIALLSAERSEDPKLQVGACIVNKKNKIVGVGYNCMPNSSDDKLPWGKSENKIECKHSYVCHAELNAIANKNSADLEGCTIYQTLFPCSECAKLIAQFGIKKVVYLNIKDNKETENASVKHLFKSVNPNIECVKYEGRVLKTSF